MGMFDVIVVIALIVSVGFTAYVTLKTIALVVFASIRSSQPGVNSATVRAMGADVDLGLWISAICWALVAFFIWLAC